MPISFIQLNVDWNAEPNAPKLAASLDGRDVILQFDVNPFIFPEFKTGERATLRFVDGSQFRLGPTNDEGWYRGQCRFSGVAPRWGEFYAIVGDPSSLDGPKDWTVITAESVTHQTHFLFYFRDSTFECVAAQCLIEPTSGNALIRTNKALPPI
jgi:hypothetical protein